MSTSLAGSGSLYIGDLHPDITESTLYDEFKSLGPIISIRVCRDTMSRISLGYAYVNFQNPIDAERAIETMNHMPIKGKPVRIMWSQRDPAMRRSGVGNVFVKGLEKDIDNRVLYDTFSAYGNILSCKVVTDEAGESKGFGFVHYDTDEAAKKAVEALNESELRGTKIFVGPFIKRSQRQSGLLSRFTNVYVKDIVDVDAEDLKGHFAKFGEVTSAFTKKDLNLNKVFGFVNYSKHEEAVEAIEQWHGKPVEGLSREENDPIYVQRAMKRAERELELRKRFLAEKAKRQFPPANNLYVKNLDDTVTSESLREAFNEYGTIMSCKVMTHPDSSVSKGFGFVCFEEADAAKKAMQEMNGRMLSGKPLYVTLAQKKDARKQHLELLYTANGGSRPNNNMMVGQGGGMMGQGGFGGMPAGPGMQMGAGFGGQGNFGYGMNPAARGMPMGGMPGMRQGGGIGGMPGMRGPRHQFPVPLQQPGMGMLGQGGRPQQVGLPRPGMGAPQLGRQGVGMAGMMPPAAGLAMGSSGLDLDTARLATMPKEAQKNMLGERLYAKIKQTDQANAAKITGMLLEMDNAEILNLLDSPELLKSKVMEAVAVLKEHSG
eukprot:Rhum_TRINITY_DN14452_c9_g1::Rhum_TRINITY_DN14452_c9_g1_i2::g.92475::m.92475/K13126/PABPC; polyadenylate-binding protein